MSIFDDLNEVADKFGRTLENRTVDSALFKEMVSVYTDLNGQDWYKTYAYSFEIVEQTDSSSPKRLVYTLPIPPENLVLNPVSASEATATMGGVVEETSETTFWNISLSGTTGIAVSKVTSDETEDENSLLSVAKHFRDKLSTTGPLSNVLNGIVNDVGSIYSSATNISSVADTLDALLPKLPYYESAVNGVSNGYTEIHKLHKFILLYSKLNSRKSSNSVSDESLKNKKWALYFVNNKDGQRYRVIVQNFQIGKSASSPYLYKYQVLMRGWSISSVDESERSASSFDRFGPDGDLANVPILSITGTVSRVKSLTRGFKRGISGDLGTFVNIPPVL